jgi:hypothetical protein
MPRSSASARLSAWNRLMVGAFPLLSRYTIIGLPGSGSQTEVVSLRPQILDLKGSATSVLHNNYIGPS